MLPWLLPEVVAALIWKWLFNPTYGLINYILQSLNIINSDVAWLDTERSAFVGVIFVAVWKGFPIVMILMTAGLKNIPAERYEAAAIDGANGWQQFRHITIPGLKPTPPAASASTSGVWSPSACSPPKSRAASCSTSWSAT